MPGKEILQRIERPEALKKDEPSWATPLAWATRRGHEAIVELLKQHGATK